MNLIACDHELSKDENNRKGERKLSEIYWLYFFGVADNNKRIFSTPNISFHSLTNEY